MPGFGQLLNGKYLKGITLILLEFLVNTQAHLNKTILLSFHGRIEDAMQQPNYGWLMFYPCLYFFAIWDAYRDAGGGQKPFSFLPFVFGGYFMAVGVIYSADFTVLEEVRGPIWVPFLFAVPGVLIGLMIQNIALRMKRNK